MANVLSIISGIRASWATSAILGRSMTSSPGLLRLENQPRVWRVVLAKASGSRGSTNVAVIPKRGSV